MPSFTDSANGLLLALLADLKKHASSKIGWLHVAWLMYDLMRAECQSKAMDEDLQQARSAAANMNEAVLEGKTGGDTGAPIAVTLAGLAALCVH